MYEENKNPAPKRVRNVPANLIWEVPDGQPLYRRGDKTVKSKQKTIVEIMGTSSYQSLITTWKKSSGSRAISAKLW